MKNLTVFRETVETGVDPRQADVVCHKSNA